MDMNLEVVIDGSGEAEKQRLKSSSIGRLVGGGSQPAWPMISKLTEEKTAALQQTQKLRHELDVLRKEISKDSGGGFSLLFVVLFGLLGILVGYFINKT